MHHVFVETNWLVDYAAPGHLQTDAALSLMRRARDGQLTLQIPASVLAAVLGRAEHIRQSDPAAELFFCDLDRDLQPWDKKGHPRIELADEYERRQIQVYGNFDMEVAGPTDPSASS